MINKIALWNWKSHSKTELTFTKGINVLIGPMGSGKSSIFQGICYALFGSIPEIKKHEVKTIELIKRNSMGPAKIELELTNGEKKFIITRILSQNKTEATVRDGDGVLLAGTNSTQVNAFLKNQLKLDEDVFLRTVYAKQNEIDLFLQLTPQDRKTRLDELMSLDKYESARKSCVKLINNLMIKKDENVKHLEAIPIDKIKQERYFLEKEIEKIKAEKEGLVKEYAEISLKKQNTETKLKNLKLEFEAFERLEAEKNVLVSQTNEINLKLSGKENLQKNELIEQRNALQSELDLIESQKININKIRNDIFAQSINSEKELGFVESKLADTELLLEQIAIAADELEKLNKSIGVQDLGAELEKLRNDIKNCDMELASKESEIKLAKKHLEELKSATGVCPVCLRALEEGTKKQLIAAIEDNLLKLANTLEAIRKEKQELENKYEEFSNAAEKSKELMRELSKKEDLLKQKAELQKRYESLSKIKEELAEKKNQVEAQLKELETKLSELRVKLIELGELLRLADLQLQKERNLKRLEEINQKLSQKPSKQRLEEAEEEYKNLISKYEELKSRINSINYIIEEKNKRLNDLLAQEEHIAKIELEIKKLQSKIEFLQQLRSALLVAQEQLRKELLQSVNELMEKIWILLYPYQKWSSIRLSANETDYSLELRTPDGVWMPVIGFASGGERMLAALTLRLAFAKILSEFDILILDEPTHNLDSAAIETFISALQEKHSEFLVNQLFIVTHEERLAEVGDKVIKLDGS